MTFSNAQVAQILKEVSTALSIKKASIFEVRAYENAASSIEHLTSEAQDLWEEGKLDDIPGVGKGLQEHLDELFKTGEVKHFDTLKKGIPEAVFTLIDVPGIGPKTAQELADLEIESVNQLEQEIKSGKLVKKGISAKIAEKLMLGVSEFRSLKSGRMLLPFAQIQAEKIIEYLKTCPEIKDADTLGSLRRQVATIGDLDFAASATNLDKALDHFIKMPGVKEVVNKGEFKATLVLTSGLHIDLLVGEPESYGALLQHFTGSKNHNIHLRTLALEKDLSLSERGIKKLKGKEKTIATKTEEEFYKILGMQTPPPEIREDNGEIEAAIAHKLPKLVEFNQIKGDLHLHSNFPLEASHGPGADSLKEIVEKAISLKYDYVGISDHSPSFTTHTPGQVMKLVQARNKTIEQLKYSYKSKIRVLNGLEIDILPNGTLSVPNEVLKTLDYVIAGVHSAHKTDKDKMTERIMKALQNPFVKIVSHPTGRLLNERQSFDADWERIFKYCAENKKILEINSSPNRLDLRDDLVKLAKQFGVKFIIDTDAHEISMMEMMPFGVAVARRGWAEAKDIVNTLSLKEFAKVFDI